MRRRVIITSPEWLLAFSFAAPGRIYVDRLFGI